MKTIIVLLFFLCPLLNAQQDVIRLIIRADDMGSSHSADEAILKSYTEGVVTSVEIMAPTPWCPEAIRLLRKYPDVDVGIHLTLTSEWENMKWRPITHGTSIADKDGYFFPMIFPNPNYPGQAIGENKPELKEIETELRAQIEFIIRKIPRVSHLSAHMGCLEFSPEAKEIGRKLAGEYNLLYETASGQVIPVHYEGLHTTSSEKVQSFINMLNKLEPGHTYLFVDHPGIDNSELEAIYHIGYEQVSKDRQGVTDVFTSTAVKEVIRLKGIRLIGYNGLLKDR